ncbi:MAG: PspA/IM30 family protein [Pirellulaceae bacterium]
MRIFCLTMLTMAFGCPAAMTAQDVEVRSVVPGQIAQAPLFTGNNVTTTWRTVGGNQEYNEAVRELQEAHEAGDDDAKEAAEDKLRGILDEQYDEALSAYEEYLEELARKIEELKDQVDKRRDAKSDMVDLRLKMIVSQAEGLGWPDRSPRGFFRPSISFDPMVSPGVTVAPTPPGVPTPSARPRRSRNVR